MNPTLPDDPSIKWMLGALIVALAGLLAYVVKALIDKIAPTLERLTTAVEKIPAAVAEAVKETVREHTPR
jgi:ABC-type Na+ efflux pump permease subunit